MNMEVALYIRKLYQLGYSASLGSFYFLLTLSQLRGNKF